MAGLQNETEQSARDNAEYRRRLRRFEVIAIEYVLPAIIFLVTLATLLTLQKGWWPSMGWAVVAAVVSGFVTRRFFIH